MFYGPRNPKGGSGTSTKRTKANTRPVPDTMSGGMPTGHKPPTPGSTSGGTAKKAVLKPARSTGTPKMNKRPATTGRMPIKPPVKPKTAVQTASGAAKTMTSAADAARLAKLKEVMNKRAASERAGKARSTGTPKMTKKPAVTGRMTRKPTTVTRKQASIQASRRR